MSVAPVPIYARAAADTRESTTLELITAAAANVAIAVLVAVSGALLTVGHRERLETTFFVAALALTPAGVAIARRQLHVVGTQGSTSLALLNAGGLSLTVIVARSAAAAIDRTDVLSWVLLLGTASVVTVDVVVHRRPLLLPSLRGRARTVSILGTCALLCGAVASFCPRSFFTPGRLWLLVVVALVVALVWAVRVPLPRGRTWRRAIDAVVLTSTALVVIDVHDYSSTFRYDYDFFLGPVNAMRHGHGLLVDTFSQYGVGIFYALSVAFRAVPLTYGGLQVILCIAYVAEFALVYGVLRLACRSQSVAIIGLAAALVVNLIGPSPPYIAYPSTGPLRFGLPWVVILAGTLRARSIESRLRFDAVMLFAVGVAAVWSAETFAYSIAAYAAITVFSIPDHLDARARSLVFTRLGVAVFASFLAVGAISALTLLVADAWPDWTSYLSLVTLYAARGFGSLLIPTWSPGYLVGALYVLSLTALIVTARNVRQRLGPTVAATAGATAFGAVAFTYFLGRSAPSNLHHVALPGVVVACGWWTIAWPHLRSLRRPYAVAAVIGASCVGASLVASDPIATGQWFRNSTLAEVTLSPAATASKLRGLLGQTEEDPWTVEGARLIRMSSTSQRPMVVLIRADRLTAVLLAARRGNALPILNGNQDGLVDEPALKGVVTAVDTLPEGTAVLTERMFMDRPAQSFAHLDPIRDHLRFGDYFVSRSYEALAQRYELREVNRGKYGYVVLQLGQHR